MPSRKQAGGPPTRRADERDDSSKTTPASDMQADDAVSPVTGGDPGAVGAPAAARGQGRGERHEQVPVRPLTNPGPNQENGPGGAR